MDGAASCPPEMSQGLMRSRWEVSSELEEARDGIRMRGCARCRLDKTWRILSVSVSGCDLVPYVCQMLLSKEYKGSLRESNKNRLKKKKMSGFVPAFHR